MIKARLSGLPKLSQDILIKFAGIVTATGHSLKINNVLIAKQLIAECLIDHNILRALPIPCLRKFVRRFTYPGSCMSSENKANQMIIAINVWICVEAALGRMMPEQLVNAGYPTSLFIIHMIDAFNFFCL